MDAEETSPLIVNVKVPPEAPVLEDNCEVSTSQKCKVFKRRWYVLFVYSLTATVSNMMFNTWGPIQRPCRLVFRWQKWTILLLCAFGAIGPILGAFPSTWLMDTKGLRISVLMTSLMLLVGKAIQVIPFSNATLRTVFIYIGHLISMLPSFVANGASPLVSSTWFPPNQRTTATAIGNLAGSFGIALAFIAGPSMIPDTVGNLTDNWDDTRSILTNQSMRYGEMENSIMNYFYLQITLAGFLFVCVIVYFPDKPPSPPSITASTKASTKISYTEEIKKLLSNLQYWLLVSVYAVSNGLYIGWTSVLDLAVQPFGINETLSGWLGTGTTLAAIISGVIIARSADIVKRWTKAILISLYIGTVLMQLLFSLTCSRILPFSRALLFVSIVCGGLLFNSTVPLFFELIVEYVFPVGEVMSIGGGLILCNAVIVMFDVSFMFPTTDVRWMNWVCVGGLAVCVPLLFAHKSQYRRLHLDTEQIT